MGKLSGTVKWFSDAKGYGFIRQEDGGEIFVHHSAIEGNGFRTLAEGERVEFEVMDEPKGPRAQNVVRLGGVEIARGGEEYVRGKELQREAQAPEDGHSLGHIKLAGVLSPEKGI